MKRAVGNVHLSKLDHFSFHKVNKTIDERMLILPKAMSISPHNIWMLYDVSIKETQEICLDSFSNGC